MAAVGLAYVIDEVFSEHRPLRAGHPERPERIIAVRDALLEADLPKRGKRVPTRAATETELGLVHSPRYIDDLVKNVPGQRGWLDADTYYCENTWDAALKAVGASVDLCAGIVRGEYSRGLAMVRPPGHHAESDRAMGFCLLNNVAIAAATARQLGMSSVAIVDWDVHHGNGT